jgi:hypothetical protein
MDHGVGIGPTWFAFKARLGYQQPRAQACRQCRIDADSDAVSQIVTADPVRAAGKARSNEVTPQKTQLWVYSSCRFGQGLDNILR